MSSNSVVLASHLLGELFGEVVQSVGQCLLSTGRAKPARQIAAETKLPIDKVSKALCALVHHGMVTFGQHKRGHVEYSVSLENVLYAGRYSQCIQFAKTRYGEAAELLVGDLILHGRVTMSSAIRKVTAKLNEAITENTERISTSVAYEKFVALTEDKLMMRWPQPVIYSDPSIIGDNPVPEYHVESNMHAIPKVSLEDIEKQLMRKASPVETDELDGEPSAKQRRIECESPDQLPDDKGIYFRIDFDRFHQRLRDRILIWAIERVFDCHAASVVSAILEMAETQSEPWAPMTNPASRYDIERHMHNAGNNTEMLDQYLSLLTDDNNRFVSKCGDGQGGLYCVEYKAAIASLTVATIENIVQERFGSKCLRVFRLIRENKYLEQKQIEEKAMFPAKDAKEITYRMFAEGFLHVKEISRTPDHAPSRTFYLFHVDLTKVVHSVLEWCYKFAVNLMVRREHENGQNKRLSEKEQRIEGILASLRLQGGDEAQLQEVKELITPPEQAQLAKLKHICNKLELSELQLDETMHVLQLYLRYHNMG